MKKPHYAHPHFGSLCLAMTGVVCYLELFAIAHSAQANLGEVGMSWSLISTIYCVALVQILFLAALVKFLMWIHPRLGHAVLAIFAVIMTLAILNQVRMLLWPDWKVGLSLRNYAISVVVLSALAFWCPRPTDREKIVFMQFLSLSGLYVFGLLFWCLYTVSSSSPNHRLELPKSPDKKQPSVHILLFDEWAVEAITDEKGMIIPRYAPHLYELSKGATWYSQWYSTYSMTVSSVPSMMGSFYRTPKMMFNLMGVMQQRQSLFDIFAKTHYMRLYSALAAPAWMDFYGHYAHVHTSARSIAAGSIMQQIKGLGRLWSIEEGLLDDDSLSNLRHATDYYVSKEENSNIVNSILKPENPLLKRKPEFVYAHFFMPHHPFCYLADGSLNIRKVTFDGQYDRRELEYILLCYRQEIMYVDRVIKEYIAKLKRNREYDNSLIVITTDHGISWEPGNNGRRVSRVNDMLSHVPMLIKFPRQKIGTIDPAIHTHLDLAPTVLEAFEKDYSFCEGQPARANRPTPHHFFYNREEWTRDPATKRWHRVMAQPPASRSQEVPLFVPEPSAQKKLKASLPKSKVAESTK